MNRLFIKKYITGIIIVGFIFIFAVLNFKNSFKEIKDTLSMARLNSLSLDETISELGKTIEDNTYKKYDFIEIYGGVQKFINKNEESNFEVVKDKDGKLHYTFFGEGAAEVGDLVGEMIKLKNAVSGGKAELIYLMTPEKYIEGYTEFPEGIPYPYFNETADKFIEELNEDGIKTIDLRDVLINDNDIDKTDAFYNTDHHWKVETSFYMFRNLENILSSEYNLNLDKDSKYTDINNYNTDTYEDVFIGSMARKTGILYGGIDNFTIIYPKFETKYKYYAEGDSYNIENEGTFEEALLNEAPWKEEDKYSASADKYGTYLFGNYKFAKITNENNPEGPKVLFIKDSFILPMASFLSTVCSDIYMIDPRYYDGSITEKVRELSSEVDFIFVSFYPQNLTEEFFNFK